MKRLISESEREVMRVLWEESPLTAAQIVERVRAVSAWSENTIKTFLSRLREKGMVTAEKRGVFYYSPTVTEEEAGLNQVREVVKKHFGGSVGALMLSFCRSGDLTENEFDELEALIHKARERKE